MPRRTIARWALCAALLVGTACPCGVEPIWAADGDPASAMVWSGSNDGLAVRGVACLRIHPKEPGTLFAHVFGMGPARSTDEGKTWEPMLAGTEIKEGIMDPDRTRITLDPREPKIMYLSLNGDLFRSSDGGAAFKKMRGGALSSHTWDKLNTARLVWEVRIDDKKSALLLAGTRSDGRHHGGLFESQDGGQNWALIAGSTMPDSGLSHDSFLIRRDPKTEKNLTVAGSQGVWYSGDRGRSFSLNLPGIRGVRTIDVRTLSEFQGSRDLYVADARGLWHSKDGGKSWGKKPLREGDAVFVGADPTHRKRIFAIFHDLGVHAQTGRKSKWIPMGGPFGESKNKAYADAELREIVGHPRDKHIVFAASPVTGLHISRDGGETFEPVATSAPEGGDDKGADDKGDGPADDDSDKKSADSKPWQWPEVTASIAAVGLHTGGGKSTHLALSKEGLVFRSDEGAAWSQVGRLGMAPRGIAAESKRPDTWYAWGRSFLRSSDNGETWEKLWADANGDDYVADYKQGPDGMIHLLLGRSGSILRWGPFGAKDTMAWKTTKTTARSLMLGAAVATSFAIDSENASHMVICTRSVKDRWVPADGAGGLFETWNGGGKWIALNDGLRRKDPVTDAYWNHGRFVAIDPAAKLILYGADWYGLRARQYVPADADAATKKAAWKEWVNITPPEGVTSLGSSAISSIAHGAGNYVMQLRAANNATALVRVDSSTLGSMWDAARVAATTKKKGTTKDADDGPPPGWSLLKDPGVVVSSLTLDESEPGRMIAADALGASGVQVFQLPVVKRDPAPPPKNDAEKNDGEKKDEGAAKKADPAPDGSAPQKDDAPKGDAPKGDAPKGDAPKGDAPKGDAPKGDEPKGDAPKGEEPKGDAPKADEPAPGEPEKSGAPGE